MFEFLTMNIYYLEMCEKKKHNKDSGVMRYAKTWGVGTPKSATLGLNNREMMEYIFHLYDGRLYGH